MKIDGKTGRDLLTNMYGRRVFFERAKAMIAEKAAGYYILSCINIENFKFINSAYGLAAGDMVLQHIADCTARGMSAAGGIAGRINGDAFAVLFPASYADSQLIADLYLESAAPACIDEKIRLRVGRFVVSVPGAPVESMYDYAKIASDSVRGNYEKHIAYYNDFMKDELLRKHQIIYEMDTALAAGQFEPWLQPQYNHATGAMIGAEVLVRWNRNGTYISPAEFIPIFEETGFIYEMDKYIWEQSCRLLRRWLDEGRSPLPLSVNISRRDILHDNFISVISELADRYNIPASLLRLEITESAFAEESGQIIEKVVRLIEMGFVVEIGDFGSGYSSLNTLKDVPSSVLKLDMRFFESTENSRRAGNIIESVVRMARLLGMAVIAEGVEEKAQADYLKSIGCYYIQGYFYARPMPVADYEALVSRNEKEPELSRIKTVETLDHHEFWNPKSMDTLIFNSYVGGACIFEYYKGRTEIIRMNDQYINEFGGILPEGIDLHGAAISKYMDSKGREKFFDTLHKALDTRKEASCEVTISNNGQTEYLRVTVRAIARADERILCYGVIANMTEQRMAEINERNMATQMDIMMKSIHAAVTATVFNDRNDFDVIYINDGLYEMYGYTKEQFEEEICHINDIILPEDKPRTMDIVEQVMRDKKALTYEFRAVKRDGSIIWIQMTNSVTALDGIGDNVLMGVAIDVTEKHLLEEREAGSMDKLKAVLNSADNGITASYRIDGKTTFLIASDRFFEIHGLSRDQADMSSIETILEITHPDDREYVSTEIRNSVIEGKNSELEYRIIRPDGKLSWVKVANSTAYISGIDAPVNVAIFSDITAEKNYNMQLEFLNEVAHEILAQPEYEEAVFHTLQKIVDYFGGERSYIVEVDYSRRIMSNTYEVCREGALSRKHQRQQLPMAEFSQWFERFDSNSPLAVPDVNDIDNSQSKLREGLLAKGITSLILVPLWKDSRLIGFVGADNPTRYIDHLVHLAALGDYLAVLLTRRDLNADIDREHQNYMKIADELPGGFVRLKKSGSGRLVLVYAGKGMRELLGMDEQEVQRVYGESILNGVHPEDIKKAIATGEKMLKERAMVSERYRILRGDGSYMWVMFSGRASTDSRGDTYLNLYYIDISEQMDREEKEQEIFDNLPCGAALYEFDGEHIETLHINKRFEEITERTVNSYNEDIWAMTYIHPEDRETIMLEVRNAVAEDRDGACTARIFCGDNTYREFYLEARIKKQENGKYLLYVTYIPVSAKMKKIMGVN